MNEEAGRAGSADRVNRDEKHDVSGDPVCWMHLLCPGCGALPTAALPDRCWQCGAPRE